jgi:DNA-binding transcriptional LysR family regulator
VPIDLNDLTLDALRAFRVFAEHRNFTRAAGEVHISQPALHVKVTKLAAALGVDLYERDGRELVLTAEGEAVARLAADLDRRLALFAADLAPAGGTEPFVLAAGEGAHLYVVAGAVRRLLAGGTGLRLLTTDAAATVEAVRAGRADLGVTVLRSRPRGLTVVPVAAYPQVLIMPAGHPLARARELSLADLAGVPLVLPPPGRPHRQTIERALRRARIRPTVAVEAQGWAPTLHFVAVGVGLAVVNGCVTPGPDLVARPVTDLDPVTYSALHRPGRAPLEQVGAVLDLVRASAP